MNPWVWIGIAVALGAGGCLSTVILFARARDQQESVRPLWFTLAAMVFGIGVWSTHFVAMLAEQPAMHMGYALTPTLLSVFLAIASAALGFAPLLGPEPTRVQRLLAGITLGAGIAAMHFTGMHAMRFGGIIHYQLGIVLLAIALGMALCTLAWRRITDLPDPRAVVEAATCLVLGIAAIHFIAMAGTLYQPNPIHMPMRHDILIGRNATVASAVTSIAAIGVAFAVGLLDQRWRWIRQQAAHLREVADCTIEGLLIHRDGTILWANTVLCDMLGTTAAELAGKAVISLVAADSIPTLQSHLTPDHRPPDHRSIDEVEIDGANFTPLRVEIASRSIHYQGKSASVIALRDITERRRTEARIRHLAFNDSLTGLPNRARFDDTLNTLVTAAGPEHPAALLMIDLDRFKAVNDLHGHPIGDRLLQHVGARLQRLVRQTDLVARLGGDEFAIVLPDTTTETASSLAKRIIASLARPFEIEGLILVLGASVGLAMAPLNATRATPLMQAADFALGRAKREGRNRFCSFEIGMDIRFRERQAIEQDLRYALEAETLDVYYQPLVDCVTLKTTGYEALVRWNHPERGAISPADFIPIAEEAGLISALGQFVLERAAITALLWPDHLTLAVNLSPLQFHNPSLPDDIIDTIARIGLAPGRLELEITETVLITDSMRTLEMLKRLKAHGIRIALDDFGTGYSSLGTLRMFPFDKLKIDRSFVQHLGADEDATSMVRAILAMGSSLRLNVTAEGVETEIQLETLRTAGCNHVQGFLLGKPTAAHLVTNETAISNEVKQKVRAR